MARETDNERKSGSEKYSAIKSENTERSKRYTRQQDISTKKMKREEVEKMKESKVILIKSG